jgi:hypothetical protein
MAVAVQPFQRRQQRRGESVLDQIGQAIVVANQVLGLTETTGLTDLTGQGETRKLQQEAARQQMADAAAARERESAGTFTPKEIARMQIEKDIVPAKAGEKGAFSVTEALPAGQEGPLQQHVFRKRDKVQPISPMQMIDLQFKKRKEAREIEKIEADKLQKEKDRTVPGLGLARNKKSADRVIDSEANARKVIGGINRLLEIANTTGSSLDPDLRAEAENIQQIMVGLLRVPLFGPGILDAREQAKMLRAVVNPTEILNLSNRMGTTGTKLNTIKNQIVKGFKEEARLAGLEVPENHFDPPKKPGEGLEDVAGKSPQVPAITAGGKALKTQQEIQAAAAAMLEQKLKAGQKAQAPKVK